LGVVSNTRLRLWDNLNQCIYYIGFADDVKWNFGTITKRVML